MRPATLFLATLIVLAACAASHAGITPIFSLAVASQPWVPVQSGRSTACFGTRFFPARCPSILQSTVPPLYSPLGTSLQPHPTTPHQPRARRTSAARTHTRGGRSPAAPRLVPSPTPPSSTLTNAALRSRASCLVAISKDVFATRRCVCSLFEGLGGDVLAVQGWLVSLLRSRGTATSPRQYPTRTTPAHQVYSWIEGRVRGAGVQGATPETAAAFLRQCGVPNVRLL